MNRQRGFSLIELLIVVAIILLLAAIAIPNYMQSRIAANEAAALGSVKLINTAQVGYSAAYPDKGFATDLTKLGKPAPGDPFTDQHAGLLDTNLGCDAQPCKKSGYQFHIGDFDANEPVTYFHAYGVPQSPGWTGRRGFCSDELSSMSYDPEGGTTCTTPVQ